MVQLGQSGQGPIRRNGAGSDTGRFSSMTVELESTTELFSRYERDPKSFSNILCTAWGLLLRAFTGEDQVKFHFRDDKDADFADRLALFQATFSAQDSLSVCMQTAETALSSGGSSDLNEPGVSSGEAYFLSQLIDSIIYVQNGTRSNEQLIGQLPMTAKVCPA